MEELEQLPEREAQGWVGNLPDMDDEAYTDESVALEPPDDPAADYRIEVLGKAAHIVSQDRNIQYGPPEDSFQRIAGMWSAYMGIDFLPTDVAAMLALLKIARLATNPVHEDSWIDLAGYAACGASSAKHLVQDEA